MNTQNNNSDEDKALLNIAVEAVSDLRDASDCAGYATPELVGKVQERFVSVLKNMKQKPKTLTRQVEEMVDKKLRLASLAGDMIATLQVNIERGYIVAVNDEGKLNLAGIMARWKRELDEIEKDT